MKKLIVSGMLAVMVMVPAGASAQTLSPEVEARIQILMAIVEQLRAQLAELLEREADEREAERDEEERCEDAKEELEDAEAALEAYAAETRDMKRKAAAAPGQTRDQAYREIEKIDIARSPGYGALRDAETRKAEAVADNCD